MDGREMTDEWKPPMRPLTDEEVLGPEPYVPVIKRELHGWTGYSVHLTFDVMGVESREEAREVIMSNLPKLEGVKVTNVHVGKYVISSLAPGLEDTL